MTLVSCRRNILDSTAYPVPVELPSGDFAGKRVLILVHGYRSDYESIVASYDTIERRIGHRYDKVIGFLWPGGWTRIGYQVSKLRADRSAGELRRLLRHLGAQRADVDVQTHSLGAHVALKCLTLVNDIGSLYLAAPAVHHDCFDLGSPFYTARIFCDHIHVLHSANDPVLGWWYRLGTFGHRALGHRGAADVERLPSNVVQVDCSSVIHGHSEYRDSPAVYAYWERSIEIPGEQQFVTLEAAA